MRLLRKGGKGMLTADLNDVREAAMWICGGPSQAQEATSEKTQRGSVPGGFDELHEGPRNGDRVKKGKNGEK